ncbi:hypothetical protein B296_00057654 [Ensete ventricosum]|uniref:Uncharacterized protein n=1 Tax=Ensete ventricosum TaxID=4639 RepID=A0A426XG70_ENSVE|nr:hypothetical protein B296_00057654 [Ensete ventricosum]
MEGDVSSPREARVGRRNLPAKPSREARASFSSPHNRRRFSPRSIKKPAGDGSGSGEQRRISKFSLFFSLFFFSLFVFLPRLIPPEIDRRPLKSTVTDQFRVVTGIPNQRYCLIAGGPVRITHIGWYDSKRQTLVSTIFSNALVSTTTHTREQGIDDCLKVSPLWYHVLTCAYGSIINPCLYDIV